MDAMAYITQDPDEVRRDIREAVAVAKLELAQGVTDGA